MKNSEMKNYIFCSFLLFCVQERYAQVQSFRNDQGLENIYITFNSCERKYTFSCGSARETQLLFSLSTDETPVNVKIDVMCQSQNSRCKNAYHLIGPNNERQIKIFQPQGNSLSVTLSRISKYFSCCQTNSGSTSLTFEVPGLNSVKNNRHQSCSERQKISNSNNNCSLTSKTTKHDAGNVSFSICKYILYEHMIRRLYFHCLKTSLLYATLGHT